MGEERMDLPQGTLDLLILKTLALEPQHGWAVSERLQQVSGQALQVGQGSLYPSLHRLERSGRIKAVWRTTENNRRAKYVRAHTRRPQATRGRNRGLATPDGGGQPGTRPVLRVTSCSAICCIACAR